jgi:hypothetical protein
VTKNFTEINPKKNPATIIDPSIFGDDWSERLDRNDFRKIDAYFRSISHIQAKFDFINCRVGGKDKVFARQRMI